MITIGYWKIKARVEPLRYLLEYLQVPYKEITYINFKDYFPIKKKLGLDFPNLPYLKDGEINISETSALEDYIIFKTKREDLLGKNQEEKIIHIEIREVIKDISRAIYFIAFKKDYKKAYITKRDFVLKKKLKYLSNFLKDKKYFLKDITFSDFLFTYYLDMLMKVEDFLNENYCVDDFDNLRNLYNRVRDLKRIKNYIENDERNNYPFFKSGAAKIKM